jgi:hypothetical protein
MENRKNTKAALKKSEPLFALWAEKRGCCRRAAHRGLAVCRGGFVAFCQKTKTIFAALSLVRYFQIEYNVI